MNSLVKGAPRERCPPRGPTSERHCDRCGTIFGPLGVDYDCCTVHSTRMCMTCDCPECIPLTTEEEEGGCRSQSSEWVVVTERLPEIGHLVLVYRPHSVQKVAAMMRLKRYEGDTQYHWDGLRGNDFCLETSITHWMPLPKPPALLPPNAEAK